MPVPLVAISAGAKVVEGVAGLVGLGGKAPTDVRAAQFVQANLAEIKAGNNATGKGLNALQFRLTTLQNDPIWYPILLGEVRQVINQGFAKVSDFRPQDVQAAGVMTADSRPGGPVNSTGGSDVVPANKAATTPTAHGVSLVTVAIILVVAAAAFWFFSRR